MTAEPVTPRRRAPVALLVIGVLILLAVNIAGFLAFRSTFSGYYIPSEAMKPTLQIGDRVLREDVSYRLHDPHRGDVIVFEAPRAAQAGFITQLVSRIVGLPGERIEGRADGHIYINGRRLREPYLPARVRSRAFEPRVIPADRYFVMGDNRQYSKDSTFYGPIPRSTIEGRMYLRYWPAGRVGVI